ncbi:hypothetical protein BK011_08590 [Tenericutes bacterium MZ-XQ]|nr:hypothetical protein BK011_08590 [Tenericutes bacterium MZ-XQ]
MPKYFNTIKLKISDEEKKLRLEDYRYALQNGFYFGPPVDIHDFMNKDIFLLSKKECVSQIEKRIFYTSISKTN